MTPLANCGIIKVARGIELLITEERKIDSMVKSLELIIQNIRVQLQGLDEEARNEVIEKALLEKSEVSIFKKVDITMLEVLKLCKNCVAGEPLPEDSNLIHHDFWLMFAKDIDKFFLENDPTAQNSKFYDERYDKFDDLAFEYVNEIIIFEKEYATKILDEIGLEGYSAETPTYHILVRCIEGYVSEIDDHYNGSVSFMEAILGATQRAIENNRYLLPH